jgi:leader peptidase (prepilin peptidase) / N-methyltransferase
VIAVAVLGALVGSFLNVLIHRLPRGESLVSPRSRCPACEAPIRPLDNVPIVSWLLLRAQCRHCHARIAMRYPLVELLTGLAFGAVALVRGPSEELALQLPFAAVMIVVAGVDLEHRIVPNKILAPAALWGLAAQTLLRPEALPEHLIAAAAAFGLLLIAALAYPGGMGMGDVKLAGVMGLYLGVAAAPALLAAFLFGSVVGGAIVIRGGLAARKKAVPFAPFLATGGLLGLLAGPELIELYTGHFLS